MLLQRFFTWTAEMSVGIEVLDDDHRKLVDLINDLHDGIVAGHGTERLGRVLDGLVSYTRTHFEHEEELFEKIGFPDAAEHIEEHRALTKMVDDVRERYNKGQFDALTLEMMEFLKNWLREHVLGSDKKYQAHLNAAGIR
jgi:hemerythrin